jgi:hypothetical protein
MDVRMYDPAIGRFNGIDPVTHFSQGTSVAFDNNPIYWADPSGADSEEEETHRNGELIGADGMTNSEWVAAKGKSPRKMGNQQTDPKKMKKKKDANCGNCNKQGLSKGFGDVEFQQFISKVISSKIEWNNFKMLFTSTPQLITNNLLATYVPVDMDNSDTLSEGDHIDIDIAGPQNGSVEVSKIIVNKNNFELYFHALDGHPDAGNIRFSGSFNPENNEVTFEVFNITRTRTAWYGDIVPFGYKLAPATARLAQKAQWNIVMQNFGKYMKNKTVNKTNITTYEWNRNKGTIGKKK